MTQYVFIPDAGADPAGMMLDFHVAEPHADFKTLSAASHGRPSRRARKSRVRVLDVFEPTGAALVDVPWGAGKTGHVAGGVLFPVVNYAMAVAEPRTGRMKIPHTLGPVGGGMFSLLLRSSRDGTPVAGAIARIRLKGSAEPVSAASDANGRLVFGLRVPAVREAMLVVEPGFLPFWGYFDQKAVLASGDTIEIDPVDLSQRPDVLREFLRPGTLNDGAGVRIGVIDTGVGPHRDLPNASGGNDTSHGHGTHVAGIIAGRGAAPYTGIAPGAEILSYRVFDDIATGVAKNYDIHKAITLAANDGCHLVNLSLRSERVLDPRFDDQVISTAIVDAADRGVLAIAAAGNDFRRFVSFPARHPDVLSVSAFGSEPCLPARAYDRWTVSPDRAGPNPDVYFANFSNQGIDGTSVDLTGPGAGVVSTVPGDGYGVMSGTSMACPAATGAIARILSRRPDLTAMPANRRRTEAMRAAALAALAPVGFSVDFEGQGMVA